MARLAALWAAVLTGLLLVGCAGGSFGQAGFSLPTADGEQTVSDAADALDGHRASGSQSAKAAIAVTDALGSFVRDISAYQRALAQGSSRRAIVRSLRQYTVEHNGKRILTGSELVMRPGGSDYCQSSAGYTVNGIPSLDETFGWESGAFSGGSRATGARGSAIWSAKAIGAVVQGEIGALSIGRSGAGASCPITEPAFVLKGGTSENAFFMPVSMAFRHGELSNLSVVGGKFANGESLEVTTPSGRQAAAVYGVINRGHTHVATFRTDAAGNGRLTITSTGAQYVVADWIVVGT